MTQFRFSAMVDSEDLHEVIHAVTRAAVGRRLDPQIRLDLPDWPGDALPEELRSRKKVDSDWPKAGSVYATVLDALSDGPKTSTELREALAAGGFKANSISSAIARLVEAGKARKSDDGAWVSA